MGGSKPKAVQTPFEQQQQQQNTFGRYSIAGTPEAQAFLNTPLDFGGNNYTGNAYQGIKNNFDFNLDPGAGRRTNLAEQASANRFNNSLTSGVPAFIRQLNRAKEQRDIRAQGAAEAQQAQFGAQNAKQQAEYQSSLARAQLQNEGELARANMLDQAAGQRTAAELNRRQLLLPQILQTGGSGSSSGFNTQIQPGQPGLFGQIIQGAGSVVGGLAAGKYL